MKITALMFFLFGNCALAGVVGKIEVQRLSDERIRLSTGCDNIEKTILGIISFNQKIDKEIYYSPRIVKTNDEECYADITDIIPRRLRGLHARATAYPGPNCWNTSLYANNIVQSLRATTEEEMSFWMNSPLCRELKLDEDQLPGDIIAIRTASDMGIKEMHGFVHLTDELSFSKSGFDIQFPYEFLSSETVYQIFALGDYGEYKANYKCRRVVGQPNAIDCPVYANIFRCMSYHEYIQSIRFATKEDYIKLDQKFLIFEKELSQNVVLERKYTPEVRTYLMRELEYLKSEYFNHIANMKLDSFLWDSMKFRILSFEIQLELLDDELNQVVSK